MESTEGVVKEEIKWLEGYHYNQIFLVNDSKLGYRNPAKKLSQLKTFLE